MPRKIGKALVIGAGISGIRAALDLAETGYGVILIDKKSHMGGLLNQLDYQFPTNRCGMCKMLPMIDRDASSQHCLRRGFHHYNIDLRLATELVSIEGESGSFQVMLQQKNNGVDPERCISCGLCINACPVEVPDAFNACMSNRKAIHLPVPYAVGQPVVIDANVCTQCGACAKVCPSHAIQLFDRDRKRFKILVVDDELIVRDSLKAWLEEEGFFVDMAESGREALAKLGHDVFHLMLIDIKMPGMDGVEVLHAAKQLFPDLTVLMMTAYATVDTAVEAMKIGARDYLIKPFDPEKMIPLILKIHQGHAAAQGQVLEVGAVVYCGGTALYNPKQGKNPYGYGTFPNVLTSIEFERLLSGIGPTEGKLKRPSDGKLLNRIGWIQCVGSRDLQCDADFCSRICCMHAIKEALLAKEKGADEIETSIFYMDMRTPEKTYQRYHDRAETDCNVRFIRGRIHSIFENDQQDLIIRYIDPSGASRETIQDMMILSIGQRPGEDMDEDAKMLGFETTPLGFAATVPFSLTRTDRTGILLGGSSAGPKDISNSVIQASAAAMGASQVIHASGGGIAPESAGAVTTIDVSRERISIHVVLCTCEETMLPTALWQNVIETLSSDPDVYKVDLLPQLCTQEKWSELSELVGAHASNRLVIGACRPHNFIRGLPELSRLTEIPPALIEAVDIRMPVLPESEVDLQDFSSRILAILEAGIAKVKYANPISAAACPVHSRALVVGGGIAGMTAALAIAEHGYRVDLVETSDALGGNLRWMCTTLEGQKTAPLLEDTVSRTEKHPLIEIHIASHVLSSLGSVGDFHTTLEDAEGSPINIHHGITVLATGGHEAPVEAYAYGLSPAIVTQKELAIQLYKNQLNPEQLETVVMVQCVGSREEPRKYCSRICCLSALKHALMLKSANPFLGIYILYRDMMAMGFAEAYYTAARKAGVIFIQFEPLKKPEIELQGALLRVKALDPIIGRTLDIKTDLLVLSAGIVPDLPDTLADALGVTVDADGFFQEADIKWRPVDGLKEGVFACGLVLSPRSVAETIATAEAAAQRALRILSRPRLPSGRVTARVRASLCCLCERCIEACPYEARWIEPEEKKIHINAAMCQGCGTCAVVCYNGAAILDGFPRQQVFATIDAAMRANPQSLLSHGIKGGT